MTLRVLPSLSFVELSEPRIPPEVFPSDPYLCLVAIRDAALANVLREPLASALVSSRCCWVSFHGADSEAFEDSVDWANVDATLHLPPEQDFVVITTSHTDESLDDVANMVANIREPACSKCLVLGIGSSASAFEEVRAAFARVL